MAAKASRWLQRLQKNAAELAVHPLRIGVTGLSRAGKTTFVTSLINQLENYQRGLLARRAPFDRLVSVRWQREGVERPFPYLEALQALQADPPHWPRSTADMSRVVIDLQFRQSGLRAGLGNRHVRLEILDYPGEWLLDLPLLQLDYGQWCEQISAWLAESPRRELAGDLLEQLQAIDPLQPCDPQQLHVLQQQWVAFLHRCRNEAGLVRNQPGRFLLPGEGVAADMLDFIPLPTVNRHTHAEEGSWWQQCQARFCFYRDFLVRGFYQQHFSRLDRQLLLVDMLAPLDAGQPALHDLKQALEAVLGSFRYASDSWLRRWFNPQISRLALCATKVDQVAPAQQRAVLRCLEDLLTDSLAEVRHGGVQVQGFPLAAIRAARSEGDTLVAGLAGTSGFVRYQPGSVPEHLPLDLAVSGPGLPALRPPPGLHRNEPFAHYRMDDLLVWMLEGRV